MKINIEVFAENVTVPDIQDSFTASRARNPNLIDHVMSVSTDGKSRSPPSATVGNGSSSTRPSTSLPRLLSAWEWILLSLVLIRSLIVMDIRWLFLILYTEIFLRNVSGLIHIPLAKGIV
mmetsp:Transcript_23242/g.42783  ORF Transcript_23242/g.42783 Transcript_23242/m.42783 type:complete len:120 (-) Transcript_23242:405-764(-)